MAPGAAVLDVPCGGGRHAVALASRGYRMTGVDVSEGQIADARAASAAAGATVAWHQREMRDLPWEGAFAAAYCLGNSYAYLDPDGTRAFLGAVGRALRPGSRFAFDTGFAAECILPRFVERESTQVDDITFEEHNRYDVTGSRIETTYTFTRGAERVVRTGWQWVFTLREIADLLRGAGFTILALCRSVAREPFTVGSPVAIVVAQKR